MDLRLKCPITRQLHKTRLCIFSENKISFISPGCSCERMAAWFSFWFVLSGFSVTFLAGDKLHRLKSAAYDELYSDARHVYSNEKWNEAVDLFEKAIADYNHEKEVKIHCRSRCRDRFRASSSHNLISDFELDYYRYTIYSHKCSQQCREKYLGKRTKVSAAVKNDFESRKTYAYLQFAYYKVGHKCMICCLLHMYFNS